MADLNSKRQQFVSAIMNGAMHLGDISLAVYTYDTPDGTLVGMHSHGIDSDAARAALVLVLASVSACLWPDEVQRAAALTLFAENSKSLAPTDTDNSKWLHSFGDRPQCNSDN